MLKNIKNFADNSKFFNPASPAATDLLSAKERFKGKIAPLLAQTSLTALSIGIGVVNFGLAPVVLFSGVLAGMSLVLQRESLRRFSEKLHEAQSYDFTKVEDAVRFAHQYPACAKVPHKYFSILKACGIEGTPPLLHVIPGERFPAVTQAVSPQGHKYQAIFMGEDFLKKRSDETLLFILGHEIGHAQLGHTARNRSVSSDVRLMLPVYAGMTMMVTGNIVGGLLYAAAGSALNKIAAGKFSQYAEREADRFALLKTGVTEQSAKLMQNFGEGVQSTLQNAREEGVLQSFKIAAAELLYKMGGSHPDPLQRAAYIREFGAANPAACDAARQRLGIPAKPFSS